MELKVSRLTSEAFSPYGEVIKVEGNDFFHINDGQTERYHDLIDIEIIDGKPVLMSINRSQPAPLPIQISVLEKHPLGSQAFMPLKGEPFVVIVAEAGEHVRLETLKAFITNGSEGVNYRRGVWHHPLFAYQTVTDFLTIDRGGTDNCLVEALPEPCTLVFE